jgi:N-acetylglucosaminyldiphosphoundecaprenol N-acetyl-beta-D-mannosaminyltransferase
MDIENSRRSIKLLGVTVHPMTLQDLTSAICDAIAGNERWILANHNLHSIYLYHHDSKMRAFYRHARDIYIDGMSLVLLGKLMGYSLKKEHRLTYIDWFPAVLRMAAQQGWRIFYLGSRPGVAARGAAVLKFGLPELRMETGHGYFNPDPQSDDSRKVVERINRYRPQILMVGMGMPLQEHWIMDHIEQLHAHVVLNVGAYIDYVAGAIPTPPRWMGFAGVEWLYRLICEPRRLWRRYLLEPWFLAGIAARNGLRRLEALTLKIRLTNAEKNQKEEP